MKKLLALVAEQAQIPVAFYPVNSSVSSWKERKGKDQKKKNEKHLSKHVVAD
jgi:hypothetical protein